MAHVHPLYIYIYCTSSNFPFTVVPTFKKRLTCKSTHITLNGCDLTLPTLHMCGMWYYYGTSNIHTPAQNLYTPDSVTVASLTHQLLNRLILANKTLSGVYWSSSLAMTVHVEHMISTCVISLLNEVIFTVDLYRFIVGFIDVTFISFIVVLLQNCWFNWCNLCRNIVTFTD